MISPTRQQQGNIGVGRDDGEAIRAHLDLAPRSVLL
jgi:hypothetical protein